MRNALILTGVWLGILVTAYAIVFWDQGIDRPLPISLLEQQAEVAASEIVHPDGLFSLTAPMGWTVVQDTTYVEMSDPNDNVTVWMLALNAVDLEIAVAEAFSVAGLEAEFVLVSQEIQAESWTGQDVRAVYENESGDDRVAIRVQSPKEWTVVMLAHGSARALEVLSENLDWIWSELAIPAEELLLL